MNRVSASIALGLLISSGAFAQFELSLRCRYRQRSYRIADRAGGRRDPQCLHECTRSTTTSPTGDFDFVALQPGQYSLTAKQPGFKVTNQTFQLAVGQRLQLDVSLEVGTATESITVGASVIAVESVSSDMNNVRTRQQVVDLPLNNRNFTQLVQLAPGVTNKGSSTNVTNGGYTAGRGTSGATINGNSSDVGVYLFDGIQSVDAGANVLIFYPPVDAIQEFKVQTNAAPAAYGGGPSVINVTFRSGTNDLHGAAV